MVIGLLAMLLGGFSGGRRGELGFWRDGEREASVSGARGQRAEERASGAAAPGRRAGRQADRQARALRREAIAQSAGLWRYAAEYASMLRVTSDRDVAKEAARVNLSALLLGRERIVALEGHSNGGQLRDAIGRGGEDLAAIRRAVSSLLSPEISKVPLRQIEHLGPQR